MINITDCPGADDGGRYGLTGSLVQMKTRPYCWFFTMSLLHVSLSLSHTHTHSCYLSFIPLCLVSMCLQCPFGGSGRTMGGKQKPATTFYENESKPTHVLATKRKDPREVEEKNVFIHDERSSRDLSAVSFQWLDLFILPPEWQKMGQQMGF